MRPRVKAGRLWGRGIEWDAIRALIASDARTPMGHERALAAEYIREQVFLQCHQEIPYSAAVTVDEFDESERSAPAPGKGSPRGGLVRIGATIHLERRSQWGIVIGKGGRMLKAIGTAARCGR